MDIAYSSSPASRPRMLMCYLCGREYGTKSLPIHQDQCKKAWLTQESQKPPRERRPLPQPPEGIEGVPKDGMDAKATQEFNDKMYEQWEKRTLESCANCGRTFRPEALARHHKSCTPENPAKPAGTALTSASLSKKPVQAKQPALQAKVERPTTSSNTHSAPTTPTAHKAARQATQPHMRKSQELAKTVGASGGHSQLSDITNGKSAAERAQPRSQDSTTASSGDDAGSASKFCDECGSAFMRETSKFCSECGTLRTP